MSNNNERNNGIVGVGANSYMSECYFGSIAKINSSHITRFLQTFLNCKGDIGLSYAKTADGEIEANLAIPFKANKKNGGNSYNKKGMIPIPGYSGGSNDQLNDELMNKLKRIRYNGVRATLIDREDAIIFRINFAAVVSEMMNPVKGFAVSIDEIKLNGNYDFTAIVSVFKSNANANTNRMTRVLQKNNSRLNGNNSNQQRYRR